MKQIKFLSYLFVAVLCLGFTSCSDDDDPTFEDSQVIGSWTVTERQGYEKYQGDTDSLDKKYEDGEWMFVFNNNNKGYQNEDGYTSTFDWNLKGNQLTMKINSTSETFKIVHLNETNAVIESKGESEYGDFYVKILLKKYSSPK